MLVVLLILLISIWTGHGTKEGDFEGDGNVFKPENICGFIEYVLKQTKEGVHFMMADGVRTDTIPQVDTWDVVLDLEGIISDRFILLQGFSVEGKENIQEILSKQLYLSQIAVALSIVRKGRF